MVDSVGFLVCFWPSGRHVDLRSQGAEGHHAARGGGAECPPLDRRAAPWAVFLSVFYLFWASGTAFWGERIGFSDLGNFFFSLPGGFDGVGDMLVVGRSG